MFSIAVVSIWVIFGVFLMVLRSKKLANGEWAQGNEGPSGIPLIFSIISGIIAGIWIISMTVGSYTCQLRDFSSVKKAKQEISLYSERRDKLVDVVRLELAKYPEYEKKIIGNIQPQMMILSRFPKLQSNETIVKTVEEIMKLEDSVYIIRASMIETQKTIFYRELSPWVVWVIPYQKFFGEANPLVGAK